MFLILICFGLCCNNRINTLYMCLRRGQIEVGMENRDICNWLITFVLFGGP